MSGFRSDMYASPSLAVVYISALGCAKFSTSSLLSSCLLAIIQKSQKSKAQPLLMAALLCGGASLSSNGGLKPLLICDIVADYAEPRAFNLGYG